ncbi:putative ncs1 nucleoside transporter protein [Neofusicoccum parvum UCRNP2]|uniref:Ncs1 nucleoside transporter protein n=2 Tax=Neofusicoccum parvum TaxID=310453 RepID=A0ACB5S0D6_9PEZI|nr:putative ncs1 nucleoside transporter protein [Neofusicoccum parvum UCRNP2]GME26239.1 putative ncs1 nucleoside transporter protein [Neofusicoccum parvum]
MRPASVLQRLQVPSSSQTVHNRWINDDIRPLPPHRRRWDRAAFISFWAINQICLSNWQLGSSLVAIGLSVWQTMIAVIVGKIIVALVAVFNGYVGADWHIGFPVVSRWTGGLCVQAILSSIFSGYQHMPNRFPASANMDTRQFVGWVIFNVLMIPILYIRPERVQSWVLWFNVISVVTLVAIMIWGLAAVGGGGPLLSSSAEVRTSSELGWGIVSGVSTVIGNIAVGLSNQMDYSRFARHPGDQVFGQYFSIMFFGTIMPLFGCLSSSATLGLYGTAYWNPPDLVQRWLDDSYTPGTRAAAFFAGCGLVVCQIAINVVDNAYSAGMDAAGLLPAYLNIRRGAYVGLVLSIALCPWELLSSAATFISVLSAYSVFLGPMVGIQICDYWLVRRRRVKLSDLYHAGPSGIYYFVRGVNWRAFVAWVVGWAPQLPGFVHAVNEEISVPAGCTHLYQLAFPLGFAISFAVFWGLNRISPPEGLGEVDPVDYFGTFSPEEAAKFGVRVEDEGAVEVVEGVDAGVDKSEAEEEGWKGK